jgi:hypothetical protein
MAKQCESQRLFHVGLLGAGLAVVTCRLLRNHPGDHESRAFAHLGGKRFNWPNRQRCKWYEVLDRELTRLDELLADVEPTASNWSWVSVLDERRVNPG